MMARTKPARKKVVNKIPLIAKIPKLPKLKNKPGHGYRTKTPGNITTTCNNIGGHIINPPIECPFRKRNQSINNVTLCHVVDVGCCIGGCDIKCEFFRWWEMASTKQRASWSFKNGIINPSMTKKHVR